MSVVSELQARQGDPATADAHAPQASSQLKETVEMGHDTASNIRPSDVADDSPAYWVGRTLGKYQVTGVLGKGGMGVVLKAHDPMIDRDVAVKVLAYSLAADAIARTRFLAEARAAGQLSHPHVANIYEVGQEGNSYYLVMEYISGGSLEERLDQNGALPVLEATRAVIDACKGIAAAHAAGLIHRDVKPANFLQAMDGSIKVTDFGLAKSNSAHNQNLTHTGTVIGTPFFMSPEQCRGETADQRSDVYALGATYYSLLTDKCPYEESSNIPQLMYAHCHGPIPDPREVNASIPVACSRIIARAMAKSPDDRYQSVNELLGDLELVAATLSGQTLSVLPSDSGRHVALSGVNSALAHVSAPVQTGQHHSRRPIVAGAGIVAAVIAASVFLFRSERPETSDLEPQPAAAAAASGEPIRIGVLHSLTGTMADSESAIVDAVLLAIDEVNESGGVLGRPLRAVVADGRSDPEVFAREAQRLIADEQVSALFGCWTSASRKAVKTIVEDADHLLVYPLQYEGLETSPNIIYMGAVPNQQILPALQWACESLGARRFYLAGSDYVFPRAAGEIIKDELGRLGAEVVGENYLRLGSSEVGPMIERIRETDPDVIINMINGDSNIAFFRTLRSAGVRSADCPTISLSIGEAGLRTLDPNDLAGHYTAWTYYESIDSTENREFVAKFREKHPQRVVTDPMESAYCAVKLWAGAAREAQSTEPRKVRHSMLELRLPAPGDLLRLDPDTWHCYKTPRIGQFQPDGRTQIVWSASNPVRPEPFPATRTATQWLALLHDLYQGWGNRWYAP